jgi:hypothetical protein
MLASASEGGEFTTDDGQASLVVLELGP